MSTKWVRVAMASVVGVLGCDSKITVTDAGRPAYIDFGNPDAAIVDRDQASKQLDASLQDAFFIDDAPPPYCGPDGGRREPMDPGGTPGCPADKNRQGCPCPEEGMKASCWPGQRIHRNRGICEDGRTVCQGTLEFGLQWGPCDGYVLPEEDAEEGAEACECFTAGRWQLDNLVPCLQQNDGKVFMYSSSLDKDGNYRCESLASPPPSPAAHWADSVLNVDCEGRFELCYTIKAGDSDQPSQDDCIIMRECFDVWYEDARSDVPLRLSGWASSDSDCGKRFMREGGYGEMTVKGLSIQCQEVDDGDGNPRVFFRTNYCPPDCKERPNDAECRDCTTGGDGEFTRD
ncbi:MAG: hypothetical protein OXU20_42455 [Myxococcales bacterium]|nr:hypothetical protein [Myxococcales bacterium]MDD9966404.1 hypothetical protein [Myxococcales bacterium]